MISARTSACISHTELELTQVTGRARTPAACLASQLLAAPHSSSAMGRTWAPPCSMGLSLQFATRLRVPISMPISSICASFRERMSSALYTPPAAMLRPPRPREYGRQRGMFSKRLKQKELQRSSSWMTYSRELRATRIAVALHTGGEEELAGARRQRTVRGLREGAVHADPAVGTRRADLRRGSFAQIYQEGG